MNKPEGYDDINISKNDKPTVGGHKCIVVKVTEGKSRAGKDQLEIWLDMAGDDAQAMLFSNQYMANTSETKKWPCRVWITDYNNAKSYGAANLKRFHTALEDSNANFFIPWGKAYESGLKGKRVGVVFGEEETEWNGRISTLVKPRYFRNIADVETAEIPDRKCLAKPEAPEFAPAAVTGEEGFMQVPDGLEDTGLPFR